MENAPKVPNYHRVAARSNTATATRAPARTATEAAEARQSANRDNDRNHLTTNSKAFPEQPPIAGTATPKAAAAFYPRKTVAVTRHKWKS